MSDITIGISPFEDFGGGENIFCRTFHIDLVTELSRFRQFDIIVLDPESSVQPDADYLIQGTFRVHASRMRISVRLMSNNHSIVWADHHDDELQNLLSVQQEILRKIVASLQVRVNQDLLGKIRRKSTANLSAYEYWLHGMEELKKGSLASDEKARRYFGMALEQDPQFSLAYSGMSLTFFNEWSCQLWERWDVSQKGAYEWARKAYELDEDNYVATLVLGRIFLYEGEYLKAENFLRTTLTLNANDTDYLAQIASCFVFLGYCDEAQELYERAVRLNPLKQHKYHHVGALIAFEQGRFEDALILGQSAVTSWVDFPAIMAAAWFETNNLDKMHVAWSTYVNDFKEKILKEDAITDAMQPIQWLINVNPYRNDTKARRFWEFINGNAVSLTSRKVNKVAVVEGNFFRHEFEWWHIAFEGKDFRLGDSKGLHDIFRMLNEPAKQFHCSDLMGTELRMKGELVFDERAKRTYRKKILELQEEIRTTEQNNDTYHAQSLQQEYDKVLTHLTASLGMGRKTRKVNDTIDKTRSAVTWRIRSAIQKISKVHPILGKHLATSVRTGVFCSYDPERPVVWT